MAKSKNKVEEKTEEKVMEEKATEETPAEKLPDFKDRFQRDINSGVIIGRLAADPDLKYLDNGRAMCQLRIFNHRDFYRPNVNGNSEDRQLVKHSSVFSVVFFGPIAEAASIPRKGDKVGISFELDQQQWNTDFGEARSYIRLLGREIDFLSSPQNRTAAAEEIPMTDAEKLVAEPPEDDIPF